MSAGAQYGDNVAPEVFLYDEERLLEVLYYRDHAVYAESVGDVTHVWP